MFCHRFETFPISILVLAEYAYVFVTIGDTFCFLKFLSLVKVPFLFFREYENR